MSGRIFYGRVASRALLLGGSVLLIVNTFDRAADAQVQLPEVVVSGAKPKPKPKPAPRHVAARPAPAPAAVPAAAAAPADTLATQTATLDQRRDTIYAPLGTAPTNISHATIEALPQGT